VSSVPAVVARAAVAFGLDPGALGPLGGATGSTWSDGRLVLRVGERLDIEIAAMSAAERHVPVPRVLDHVRFDGFDAMLLEKVAGRPAGDVAMGDPALGAAVGRACGALHDELERAAAPHGLRRPPHAGADGRHLLHLDLHAYNVLVDDHGSPTGVIDWANTCAGDPELDRARTWSLLTLDPAARDRQSDAGWAALTDHWLQAGRLRDLTVEAHRWSCRFMLADLASRHSEADLAHIRPDAGEA
jgi:Ser/Thr protein kinase RdoA (MazF antagonist)